MFKTKRYYKKCLAMQISNNKMINEKLMQEKQYSHSIALDQKSLKEQITEYKKEIKVLKSKVTKLTNQMKKIKEEN